jgi:Na+-driven multidrug efflux pump
MPNVIRIAVDYLYACAWGVPPVMIYVSLRFVAEGLGPHETAHDDSRRCPSDKHTD